MKNAVFRKDIVISELWRKGICVAHCISAMPRGGYTNCCSTTQQKRHLIFYVPQEKEDDFKQQ